MVFRIIILILLLFPQVAFSGTCWNGGSSGSSPWTVLNGSGGSASCAYSDVNYCVNTVAAAGDRVIVGAGSATWTSRLTISKAIELEGAGIDVTTITNGVGGTCEYSEECSLLLINPSNYSIDNRIIISGFTFSANSKRLIMLGVARTGPFTLQTQVRIHHNKFLGPGISGGAIFNQGTLYGVIDNNQILNFSYPISHSGASYATWWDNSPQSIFSLGSAYYMYFEDNTINQGTASGSDFIVSNGQYSARYVFRYNNVIITEGSFNLWEIHGVNMDKSMDACFGAELYGNDINNTTGSQYLAFFKQRSGQTRIMYNRYTTNNSSNVYYIPYQNTDPGYDECPTGSNYQDKITHNSYWFQNRKITGGTAYKFRPWHGGDAGKYNCNAVIGFPRYGRDVIAEQFEPTDSYLPEGTEGGSTHDDINVTCGTLASRPTTCTTGQGYWATNQSCSDLSGMVGVNPATKVSGSLYRCISTNTWSSLGDGITYSPYTYPHPLRGVGDVTPPIVTITSPTSATTYTASSTPLSMGGTASDNVGVTSVSYANSAGGSGSCTGTTSWTCSVPLSYGSNAVTISASDAVSNIGTDVLTVTYPQQITVSTSFNAVQGSISPTSRLVTSGNTTTFTVTANTGYQIFTVTGCGGSLAGATYTTGTITSACTVTATFTSVDVTPPVISGAYPSAEQKCSVRRVPLTIGITTNENATCRYSTLNTSYDSMSLTFSGSGTTSHSVSITPTCGITHTYYVHCRDTVGNTTSTPGTITFTVTPQYWRRGHNVDIR